MKRKVELLAAVALLGCLRSPAQSPANYDEAKVPAYTLPDLLKMRNGEPVRDANAWKTRRREILELYRSEVFGRTPVQTPKLISELRSIDKKALEGKAVRKEVRIYFAGKNTGPAMDLLIYLPAGAGKAVPVFLGLGFQGNQSVGADPGVAMAEEWVRDPETKAMVKKRATERAKAASRWPVEMILERGFGLATAYYGDIEPDFDGGMRYGVRPLFFKAGRTAPRADEWGAIGAWAWGLSRAMDYLEKDKDIDAKRVALIGHSRLGKTALWAGAQDERFSIVISNDSGEGGAAISRRIFGEQIENLNTSFPHWFCANFKRYNGRETELPVDSHMLLALIAPRPLYVASANEDQWADPKGEFLGLVNASPAYALLGKQGLGTDRMPAVDQPLIGRTLAYHVRTGKHDITAYDWEQYLKFAAAQWGPK
jgi:hypothetical protein